LTFAKVRQIPDPGRKTSISDFANVWQNQGKIAKAWQKHNSRAPRILPMFGKNA